MVDVGDTGQLSATYEKICTARSAGKYVLTSRAPWLGTSNRKLAISLAKPVAPPPGVEVWLALNVTTPRGLKVWSCNKSSRMRRRSTPNLMVWLRRIFVQELTKSMLASARNHGKLGEYPVSGLLKLVILMPTNPLVKTFTFTFGIPRAVVSAFP